MLTSTLGTRQSSETGDYIQSAADAVGHLVACQYEHVRPGVYRADFTLAAPADGGGSSRSSTDVCAVLDVAAASGAAILASREVHIGEVAGEGTTFSLVFTLREFRALEYRVFATGTAPLQAWEPNLTLISAGIQPWPPADPEQPTRDPVELARQVRAVLRLLEPRAAVGQHKVRLGNLGDGGYVSLDDFRSGDIALSLGISNDISWDLQVADRGLTIYQFDHTVDDPAPHDSRMTFQKKMIAAETTECSQSLHDLVVKFDRNEARPNILLKMDIEGAEWPVWESTPPAALARFSQILCEVHWLERLADAEYRARVYRIFAELSNHYAVVHVHANICGGIANIGNVVFPNVLEISFANRQMYDFEPTDELFPGPLDISCDAYSPDMYLGSFRF
jgi:hypothetical protein